MRCAFPLLLLALATQAAACRAPGSFTVPNGDAKLSAHIAGRGPPVMMLPSLGRGPADFDRLAADVVAAGHSVVRFDPRWFGRSDGPEAESLLDIAGDAVAVADAACPGTPMTVIGHAFGNRVARAMASIKPGTTRSLILLAAGGQVPIPPDISRAIAVSAAQGQASDADRLQALKVAFFANGHDPSVWLTGWSPRAAALQSRALRTTAANDWQSAGKAPILIVQALNDPVAPRANADALLAALPGRAKMVTLEPASHAILPEQPAAVSAVVPAWLKGVRDAGALQRQVDGHRAGS